MSKTRISIATVGHMPAELSRAKLKNWKSGVFEIVGDVETYTLACDSDGPDWEFTDELIEDVLPKSFEGDFLIAIVNVPIEDNWYSRRLSGNRVVFTFYEIKEFLRFSNIPLENVIYRLLYAYTLLFKRSGSRIPRTEEPTNFTHDETRGCVFDMNGIKSDVIYSCHKPIICSDCIERLRRERVSDETIRKCQGELKSVKRYLFFQISDFIKSHPIWSIAISSIVAVLLGAAGSVLGALIYEAARSSA